MDTFLDKEKVDQEKQARWTENNSAVMRNIADATEVLNLAQVIELNRLTEKIEPSGLLEL